MRPASSTRGGVVILALGVALAACGAPAPEMPEPEADAQPAPSRPSDGTFHIDPYWPQDLPGDWLLGNVVGVAVDSSDNVWIIHRPNSQRGGEDTPPVIAFDQAGAVAHSWGDPGGDCDWGTQTHGIYVDHEDNVWITGLNPLEQAYTDPTDRTDDMILKFTSSGEFLGQFGGRDRHPLGQGGNADTDSVHLATEAVVFPETNELFVADGYANRRVLVLDAQTLQFKRMWGAFGNQPLPDLGRDASPTSAAADMDLTVDPDGPDIFNSVHALKVSNDGLVYVGDRNHRRIQVFTLDGEYVEQGFINLDGADNMTACGLDFSPDPQQEFIYVGDYGNGHVHIVRRDTLEVVGSFGDLGPDRGDFRGLHTLAVDSQGNIWTAETQPRPVGSRVQRFRLQ